MSLAIDTDDVASVLIGGDWIEIEPGSFDLDAYEFIHKYGEGLDDWQLILGGGVCKEVTATGFRGVVAGAEPGYTRSVICGPLTSLQAVRVEPQ